MTDGEKDRVFKGEEEGAEDVNDWYDDDSDEDDSEQDYDDEAYDWDRELDRQLDQQWQAYMKQETDKYFAETAYSDNDHFYDIDNDSFWEDDDDDEQQEKYFKKIMTSYDKDCEDEDDFLFSLLRELRLDSMKKCELTPPLYKTGSYQSIQSTIQQVVDQYLQKQQQQQLQH
jgi:hypothetical protein